ncbi:Ig-like domain-containing protein [Exiguobacterium mexicanum]|uniref:Ig-like domain-containing protein n=1 Tax=Exiguobacterium mexicanum TaxID=340146 RepID=UPI0037BEED06
MTGIEEGKTYQQAKPIFTEGIAKLNGLSYKSGTLITLEGDHVLIVTDEAGNETKIAFTIDHTAPAVKGYVEGKTYYREVTPTFTEGTATLNGQSFASGTTISTDGDYELKVKDKTGNETAVRFKVDRKPVLVTGVENGKIYQQVKPTFTEGTGKLNGAAYTSGTTIDQTGDYVLIIVDEAGNETKLSFSIDRTAPIITGLVEGKNSYREVTPLFNEGTASLNGKVFVSGTQLVQEGKYVFKVTDGVGNATTREFTIDRTAPVVSGVTSKQLTNKSVIVSFNEGSATLNGKKIASEQAVVASGAYSLRVTDEAGNSKLVTFTIDKVAPSKPTVSTLTNKSTKVTGKAEKESTVSITYNGRTYTTKATTAGTYSYSLKTTKAGTTVSVRAKDAAGNLSSTASLRVLNTFATFTVNTVKSSATSVTGKGNKAATIQAFVGTKAISKTAKVDSKGNYKLTIPRQKAGATVTVKMTQTGYQELKKMTKVIK